MTRSPHPVVAAVAASLALAACTAPAASSPSSSAPAAAPVAPATPTVTVTVTSPPSATATSSAPSPAATATQTPSASPTARKVTLGIKLPMTSGLGTVKPSSFAASGHPTAIVDNVVWTSWGGPTAEGTGRASWVGPGMSTAEGVPSKVRITAGEPKMCNGQYAYSKVRWSFPDHPESKSSGWSFDLCSR